MKVGILTLHSQLNYGGVLQCWALTQVLKRMGHDVVVIDRWLDERNAHLTGNIDWRSIKSWGKTFCKVLLGRETIGGILRRCRTRRFVNALGLSKYHFVKWRDAPESLGVDCLVVGSDQVWHGGDFGEPEVYLLEGAPKVKAIAYAASFGMKSLLPTVDYAAGFRRFHAISVREAEGVALVTQMGCAATHVVDPTLLLPREAWHTGGNWKDIGKIKGRIVCYFLSQNAAETIPALDDWAREHSCSVEILGDNLGGCRNKHLVRVCVGYGPNEFVQAFSRAEMCITDSFHAVAFSSIFGCNLRFLCPKEDSRRSMFSRVTEFASVAVVGNPFVNTVSEALESFGCGDMTKYNYDAIDVRRKESHRWLEKALG